MIDLEWMAWTVPTATFFICIALMLIGMTALQIIWPTYERKGLLPMPTTRGDRLFIALLVAAFIHLGFVYATEIETFWLPLGISAAVGLLILRFG
jgi:predicted small integral membrane protein